MAGRHDAMSGMKVQGILLRPLFSTCFQTHAAASAQMPRRPFPPSHTCVEGTRIQRLHLLIGRWACVLVSGVCPRFSNIDRHRPLGGRSRAPHASWRRALCVTWKCRQACQRDSLATQGYTSSQLLCARPCVLLCMWDWRYVLHTLYAQNV